MSDPVYGFESMTTKSLEHYYNLDKNNKEEAVRLLDELGLSLLVLDDGWRATNTRYPKNIRFVLSTGHYSDSFRKLIIKQFEKFFGAGCCSENGVKSVDLRLNNKASNKMCEIIIENLGNDIDIVKSKVYNTKQTKEMMQQNEGV